MEALEVSFISKAFKSRFLLLDSHFFHFKKRLSFLHYSAENKLIHLIMLVLPFQRFVLWPNVNPRAQKLRWTINPGAKSLISPIRPNKASQVVLVSTETPLIRQKLAHTRASEV